MGKFRYLFYNIPVIIYLVAICLVICADTLYFTDCGKAVLSFAVLLCAGVTMCRGKTWGAYLAIAFYGVWSVVDYFEYMEFLKSQAASPVPDIYIPAYYITIPLILFYICCIYKLKKER